MTTKKTTGTASTEETGKSQDAAKKAAAMKREVTGADIETIDVSVTVRGEDLSFTCPASIEDAPMDVGFHLEDEKPLKAFRLLLGDEAVERMRTAGATMRNFGEFIEAWTDAVGLGK